MSEAEGLKSKSKPHTGDVEPMELPAAQDQLLQRQ